MHNIKELDYETVFKNGKVNKRTCINDRLIESKKEPSYKKSISRLKHVLGISSDISIVYRGCAFY